MVGRIGWDRQGNARWGIVWYGRVGWGREIM